MSTMVSAVPRQGEIECDHDLHAFLCGLEADSSLFLPDQLRERLIALDDLDAGFGGFNSEDSTRCTDSRLHQRAKTLRTRLEAANSELYQSVRSDIVRGGQPRALLHWLEDSAGQNESKGPLPGMGFDYRDELVSGVLQLREPSEPDLQRSAEMVPYQPTPVRHILHLIAATALAEDDVFVDLGSGLGHVPLLVSMVTGAQSLGIEVQAAYVASARECAQSLHLSPVRFIPQDAREADLSSLLAKDGNGIEICDAATGKLIRRIPWSLTTSTPGVQRTIKRLEFNAAGTQLEVSSNGENDLVFDVSSGQLVATLTSTQQGQFSRDGTTFVGGNGKHLIAWSTKDWSKLSDSPNGPDYVTQIAAFPEKDLAVVGGPKNARLVHISSGEEVAKVGLGYTNFAAFNRDGTLVFAYTSGGFGVWDTSGKQYCHKEGLGNGTIAISSDGRWLAAALVDGGTNVAIWDLKNLTGVCGGSAP